MIKAATTKPFESTLPARYVRALRALQEGIRENPESFDLDDWGVDLRNEEMPAWVAREFQLLLSIGNWPKRFRTDPPMVTTPKKAVKRIDYFLEHGE